MRAAIGLVIAACFATGVFWQTVQAQTVQEPPGLGACEQGQFSREGECEDRDPVTPPPEETEALGAFPLASCRTTLGYVQVGARQCQTFRRGPDTFANAEADCKNLFGRVADYGDWRYRILFGDGIRPEVGWWLGPITADNRALFVNRFNLTDFDGETSRFDERFYVCAHDDDSNQ